MDLKELKKKIKQLNREDIPKELKLSKGVVIVDLIYFIKNHLRFLEMQEQKKISEVDRRQVKLYFSRLKNVYEKII